MAISFQLFDKVAIRNKNVVGEIVDVFEDDGTLYYTVQSDEKGMVDDPDAYPGEYPLYDCTAADLIKL